jgi:hypothetical protein
MKIKIGLNVLSVGEYWDKNQVNKIYRVIGFDGGHVMLVHKDYEAGLVMHIPKKSFWEIFTLCKSIRKMNIVNLYDETKRQDHLICNGFKKVMGGEWKLNMHHNYIDLRISVYNTKKGMFPNGMDKMQLILDYDNARVNIDVHRQGKYKSYEKSIVATLRLALSDAKATSHYGISNDY